MLVDQNVTNFQYRDLNKLLLGYGQVDYAFEILQSMPLDIAGNIYVWEDFIIYCCEEDRYSLLREFFKLHFAKVLPNYSQDVENIYSALLTQICKSKGVKEVLCGIFDDFSEFKLKIKGSLLRDALLKLLDERVDQRTFYQKVTYVKYNLDAWAYGSLITRLLQLRRKIEVLALVDMVINDPGFKFKFSDMNLTNTDMKQIIAAQNLSMKCLMEENDKLSEQKDDSKSEASIIDKLSFEELSNFDPDDEYLEF